MLTITPEVVSLRVVRPPRQRLNRCTMYDSTIVCCKVGAEYVAKCSHRKAVTTKQYISYAILSTNVRQRNLKFLAIMSPLGTMFGQEGAELRVSWGQTVRAEVIAASVGVQVQRYPMFARFVAVVGVAHEGRRQSVYRRRQSVFWYDAAKGRSGARVLRH